MRTVALLHAPGRAWQGLKTQLGHRGAYLLPAGLAWIATGFGIIIDPRYGTVRGVAILENLFPLNVFGWGWVACGLIAVVFAFVRTPGRDATGFIAAVLPALFWSGANAAAWFSSDYPKAWTAAITWGLAATRLMVVAGWREQETGAPR